MQWPSGSPPGHVVRINGPKNTALLVFLPSAWWQRLIFGKQIEIADMKLKPDSSWVGSRDRPAGLKLVGTMFCRSCSPVGILSYI